MRQLTKSPCLDNVIRQVGGMVQQRRSWPAWPRSSHRSVHKSTPVTGRVTAFTNGEVKWATLITRNDSGKRLNVTVREKKYTFNNPSSASRGKWRRELGFVLVITWLSIQHTSGLQFNSDFAAYLYVQMDVWSIFCSDFERINGLFIIHFLCVHWLKGPVWFFLDVHEPGAQRCSYATWRLRRYSIHQCHLLSA